MDGVDLRGHRMTSKQNNAAQSCPHVSESSQRQSYSHVIGCVIGLVESAQRGDKNWR